MPSSAQPAAREQSTRCANQTAATVCAACVTAACAGPGSQPGWHRQGDGRVGSWLAVRAWLALRWWGAAWAGLAGCGRHLDGGGSVVGVEDPGSPARAHRAQQLPCQLEDREGEGRAGSAGWLWKTTRRGRGRGHQPRVASKLPLGSRWEAGAVATPERLPHLHCRLVSVFREHDVAVTCRSVGHRLHQLRLCALAHLRRLG